MKQSWCFSVVSKTIDWLIEACEWQPSIAPSILGLRMPCSSQYWRALYDKLTFRGPNCSLLTKHWSAYLIWILLLLHLLKNSRHNAFSHACAPVSCGRDVLHFDWLLFWLQALHRSTELCLQMRQSNHHCALWAHPASIDISGSTQSLLGRERLVKTFYVVLKSENLKFAWSCMIYFNFFWDFYISNFFIFFISMSYVYA